MDVQVPTIKSLFIEMLYNEQVLSSGTAILAAISNDTPCVLITNRHNVTGAKVSVAVKWGQKCYG